MRDEYHVIDPNPTAGERIGWNLRPRDREKEIGPQFRFHHRVGLQRMYDKLSGEVQKTFVDFDATSPELQDHVQ